MELIYNETRAVLKTPEMVILLLPNPTYIAFTQQDPVEISVSGFTYEDLAQRHRDTVAALLRPKRIVSQRIERILNGSTYPINLPLPSEDDFSECRLHLQDAFDLLKRLPDMKLIYPEPDKESEESVISQLMDPKMILVIHRSALRSLRRAQAACPPGAAHDQAAYFTGRSAFLVGNFSEAREAFAAVAERSALRQFAVERIELLEACSEEYVDAYRLGWLHKIAGDTVMANRYLSKAVESNCRALLRAVKDMEKNW